MGKYKVADTPSGFKTLIYTDTKDSREFRLHSAYSPVKESERTADLFKPGRSNLIIIAGLALGYHVKYLQKKYPAHRIIIIERDAEVADIVREFYPENIDTFSIINSQDDIPLIFETIDISMIRGVSAYIHRPSYLLENGFYEAILKKIKEYISSKISDLLTRFEFEESWIKNIFKNVHWLYSATHVSGLFGKFENIPGIIVSAGPSLKKNVGLLKDFRDRALIVCVDTALKIMLRHNIVPDLVMTLDSQKYSLKHFLGSGKSDAILLADVVSYPRILESYKGGKILSTTSKYYADDKGTLKRETTPVWDWIEEHTGPIGDLQSGGSVATSVFDLLLSLRCNPIILIGQDLAYTGREIHCAGTYHNDEWLQKTSRFYNLETINQNVIRKRKIKYVEAYKGGGKVISDFIFDVYRAWFADSAGKVGIPVINSTEGGARIHNTIEAPLRETLLKTALQDISPGQILKQIMSQKRDNSGSNKLLYGINNAIRNLEELKITLTKTGDNILSVEEISDIIENSLKLIMPFLRKTYVYFSRHNLPEKKAGELLINDCIASLKKLEAMLKLCKINLEKIR